MTFEVHAECAAAFLAAVQANARLSLEQEPECRRFDVAVGENGPEKIFLYELYNDRAAFDAHLANAHFKEFDAQISDWVMSKDVQTFTLTG